MDKLKWAILQRYGTTNFHRPWKRAKAIEIKHHPQNYFKFRGWLKIVEVYFVIDLTQKIFS